MHIIYLFIYIYVVVWCMFVTSKSITRCIDSFISGLQSHLIAYLLGGSGYRHWRLDLEMRCTQEWVLCTRGPLKCAKATFFFEVGEVRSIFYSGSKILLESRMLNGCEARA
jgi:hypothetical protein